MLLILLSPSQTKSLTVSIKHPNHAIIKPVKKLNLDRQTIIICSIFGFVETNID